MNYLLVMRKYALIIASIGTMQLIAMACERKPPAPDIKAKLEKAMADQLSQEHPGTAQYRQFTILDVAWYEETDHYDCEFKVRLHRANGTDTTGLIKGTVSKDFTRVSKR